MTYPNSNNSTAQTSRVDPICDRYFGDVERAERASDWFFYVAVALSFLTLFVERVTYPWTYQILMVLFALSVMAVFFIGHLARLYLTPRAEDMRRQDFFSSAFRTQLTHETTRGYYNNTLTEPIQRTAAQLLENALFTKTIARRMAVQERIKLATYVTLWVIALLMRNTDLGVIVAASQAVLSEQLLSRSFRLESLRMRCEKVYDDVYRLFQSDTRAEQFTALALDSLLMYEAAKANGGITLSSKLFQKMNTQLSAEWEQVKTSLRIA